jgi:ubiquitin carboxyl-terminal hydrolase 4/11/15
LGSKASPKPDAIVFDTQLPTPPDEPDTSYGHTGPSKLYTMIQGPGDASGLRSFNHHGSSYPESSGGSSASSPPVLEDVEPPSFDDSQYDDLIATPMDPLHLASQHFDFPDPSQRASPTSSVGAEPDTDDARMGRWAVRPFAFPGSYERDSSVERSSSRMVSPTGSNDSEHEGSKYDDTHTHNEGVDL